MQNATLIIPAYNEVDRFEPAAFAAMLEQDANLWLCFVNDGSTDATEALLHRFKEEREDRVLLLSLKTNSGKAQAVRHGILQADRVLPPQDWIGYWDADLAVPGDQTVLFRRAMQSCSPDIKVLLGSRIKRLGADIVRRPLRHLLGRVFATTVSLMLNLPVYDSQCGAKFFRREIVQAIFEEPFVSRWLFDVELLARIIVIFGHAALIDSALEIPLTRWEEKGGSKLLPADISKVPLELIRIWRKYLSSGHIAHGEIV